MDITSLLTDLEKLATVPIETVPRAWGTNPGDSRAWAASGNVD